MSLKAQAISGVKWNGISMVVITALQFVRVAILARLLSPTDFGLMGMIWVVIGFAQAFADMGISNAIIYRQDAAKQQLSSLYWLNILAGIAVFLIVCASTPLIVTFYHEPRLTNLIYLTALVFLITPIGQQFQMLMQKELQFKHLARIEIVNTFADSMVAIILAFAGLGVFCLVWGLLAGTLIQVLLLCHWGWKHWRPHWHFSRRDLSGYISFGLYQMGERTVNYFNSSLDYLLIGSMFGAKALGYYTLAHNLIMKPSYRINPIITKVAFPVFSKVQTDINRLKRGYLKVLQLTACVNFPMMFGLAVVAPIAVPVIFGEQWLPSVILIQILTIVGLLRSTGNPVGSLLLARGRADLGFKWNVALIITQALGLYIGAKLGGTLGVATAFAVLMGIYTIFNYLILIRILLGSCLYEYVFSMWPSLWMSTVMTGVVLCTGILVQHLPQQMLLITQILIGVAIYLGLIIYSQKMLISEIREMIWPRRVSA